MDIEKLLAGLETTETHLRQIRLTQMAAYVREAIRAIKHLRAETHIEPGELTPGPIRVGPKEGAPTVKPRELTEEEMENLRDGLDLETEEDAHDFYTQEEPDDPSEATGAD